MNTASSARRFQFDSLEQQRFTDTLGMWIFLATEVLFFGVLFLVYAVYRYLYPTAFIQGSGELSWLLGTVNTAVLLTSSMTVALADTISRSMPLWKINLLLAATLLLGLAFLGIKGYEYYSEYQHQLIPFLNDEFMWDSRAGEGARPEQGKLFFNLYFAMTGLHALHLLIGCAALLLLLLKNLSRRLDNSNHMQVRLTALYWHFVDIVWVFLFPLLYLVR